MKSVKRLAIVGMASIAVGASTLLIASPAHAEVNDGCHQLVLQAQYFDNMTVVYRGAFGASYFKTLQSERAANQAWSQWMGTCY